MFSCLKNKAIKIALQQLKERVLNPNLEGIGIVKDMVYEDKKLRLTLILAGLEDKPITIQCDDIVIAEDGSSIIVEKFESNMEFARNALNRFATRRFDVPEGMARFALKSAKTVLGL